MKKLTGFRLPKRKSEPSNPVGLQKRKSEPSDAGVQLSGNYILPASSIEISLKKAHSCCPDEFIKVTEIPHLRQGHLSTIQFSCTRCHLNYYVSEPTKENIDFRGGANLNPVSHLLQI